MHAYTDMIWEGEREWDYLFLFSLFLFSFYICFTVFLRPYDYLSLCTLLLLYWHRLTHRTSGLLVIVERD